VLHECRNPIKNFRRIAKQVGGLTKSDVVGYYYSHKHAKKLAAAKFAGQCSSCHLQLCNLAGATSQVPPQLSTEKVAIAYEAGLVAPILASPHIAGTFAMAQTTYLKTVSSYAACGEYSKQERSSLSDPAIESFTELWSTIHEHACLHEHATAASVTPSKCLESGQKAALNRLNSILLDNDLVVS
jgi:hypothetical protein